MKTETLKKRMKALEVEMEQVKQWVIGHIGEEKARRKKLRDIYNELLNGNK